LVIAAKVNQCEARLSRNPTPHQNLLALTLHDGFSTTEPTGRGEDLLLRPLNPLGAALRTVIAARAISTWTIATGVVSTWTIATGAISTWTIATGVIAIRAS
jgi:hypothetical protein